MQLDESIIRKFLVLICRYRIIRPDMWLAAFVSFPYMRYHPVYATSPFRVPPESHRIDNSAGPFPDWRMKVFSSFSAEGWALFIFPPRMVYACCYTPILSAKAFCRCMRITLLSHLSPAICSGASIGYFNHLFV